MSGYDNSYIGLIDRQSAEVLKLIKGQVLKTICYTMEIEFSLSTLLIFESFAIELRSENIKRNNKEYDDMVHITAKIIWLLPAHESEGIYDRKYQCIEKNKTVEDIHVVRDCIEWEDECNKTYNVIKNDAIIILETRNENIVFVTMDAGGAFPIEIYFSDSVLESFRSIQEMYPFECETDVIYKREKIEIYKVEKG